MHRFDEEDHEPVAVVRTLSDFAMALTLVVLMLVGTHSAAAAKHRAQSHAATAQNTGRPAEVNLLLTDGGRFILPAAGAEKQQVTATSLAGQWSSAHPNDNATIVLHFAPNMLATDLHRALLELQVAFGAHLARVETVPQP